MVVESDPLYFYSFIPAFTGERGHLASNSLPSPQNRKAGYVTSTVWPLREASWPSWLGSCYQLCFVNQGCTEAKITNQPKGSALTSRAVLILSYCRQHV